MARTSQHWSCGEELAERLQWLAHSSARQGVDCSLLIFRPLEQTPPSNSESYPGDGDPLLALAERIRPYVRHTDTLEVAGRNAVALILYAADRQGTHAAFQRLRDRLAAPAMPGDPVFPITIGYATHIAASSDERTIADTIHAAWKPRVLLNVSLSASLSGPVVCGDKTALKASNPMEGKHVAALRPVVTSTRPSRRAHLHLVALNAQAQPVNEGLRARAHALGVPFVQLPSRLPANCRNTIAPELARELNAVPIGRSRSMLTVAMHDPSDANAVLRLRSATGLTIFPVLAASDELERALRQIVRA